MPILVQKLYENTSKATSWPKTELFEGIHFFETPLKLRETLRNGTPSLTQIIRNFSPWLG